MGGVLCLWHASSVLCVHVFFCFFCVRASAAVTARVDTTTRLTPRRSRASARRCLEPKQELLLQKVLATGRIQLLGGRVDESGQVGHLVNVCVEVHHGVGELLRVRIERLELRLVGLDEGIETLLGQRGNWVVNTVHKGWEAAKAAVRGAAASPGYGMHLREGVVVGPRASRLVLRLLE